MTKDTALNLLGWTAVAVAIPFIIVAAIICSAFEMLMVAFVVTASLVMERRSKP